MTEQELAQRVMKAFLRKMAESAWEKLLRYVSGVNTTKYQSVVQKKNMKDPTIRQEVSEIIGGEMAGELKDSYTKTQNYSKGIARLTAKWGLNEEQIRKLFLEPGAVLGEYVFELPKEKPPSLAKKILDALKNIPKQDFEAAKALAKEMVDQSRIKNKPSFYKALAQVRDRLDLERALYNLDLKYQGLGTELKPEPTLAAEGEEGQVLLEKCHMNGEGAGRPDSDFDPDQLRLGIQVEMEHTSDPEIAKQIAKDHLVEDAKYYDKLKIMEETFESKLAVRVVATYLKYAA